MKLSVSMWPGSGEIQNRFVLGWGEGVVVVDVG